MKRIISIIAAAAALLSVSSCEDFIDGLLNNYFCGESCVIVGSAKIAQSSLGLTCITLNPKDETDTEDSYSLLMTAEQFEKAKKAEVSLVDEGISVASYVDNGAKYITVLTKEAAGASKDISDVYSMTPTDFQGTLAITENSDGSMKIIVKSSVTLATLKDASVTKEFSLNCTYNGTPTYTK